MQFDTSFPIWLQLLTEFSRRIVTGEWPAGEKIPGVRELAVTLGVNPNTVQRALAEMERDALCRSERTSGRFVTDDDDRIISLRRTLVAEAADDYIRASRGLGMDIRDARAVVDERWTNHDSADRNRTQEPGDHAKNRD